MSAVFIYIITCSLSVFLRLIILFFLFLIILFRLLCLYTILAYFWLRLYAWESYKAICIYYRIGKFINKSFVNNDFYNSKNSSYLIRIIDFLTKNLLLFYDITSSKQVYFRSWFNRSSRSKYWILKFRDK